MSTENETATNAPPLTKWYLEYYNGFPNIRFGIEVMATTQEEARRKGDEAIRGLRTVACYDAKYR